MPALALVLLAVLLIPYVILMGLRPRQIDRLPLPGGLAHMLAQVAHQIHEEEHVGQQRVDAWWVIWLAPGALVIIILASIELVQAALALAEVWHLPQSLVGGVILAALTRIPNAYTAVHLAQRGRGAAVVSATVNNNTLNLVIG